MYMWYIMSGMYQCRDIMLLRRLIFDHWHFGPWRLQLTVHFCYKHHPYLLYCVQVCTILLLIAIKNYILSQAVLLVWWKNTDIIDPVFFVLKKKSFFSRPFGPVPRGQIARCPTPRQHAAPATSSPGRQRTSWAHSTTTWSCDVRADETRTKCAKIVILFGLASKNPRESDFLRSKTTF